MAFLLDAEGISFTDVTSRSIEGAGREVEIRTWRVESAERVMLLEESIGGGGAKLLLGKEEEEEEEEEEVVLALDLSAFARRSWFVKSLMAGSAEGLGWITVISRPEAGRTRNGLGRGVVAFCVIEEWGLFLLIVGVEGMLKKGENERTAPIF